MPSTIKADLRYAACQPTCKRRKGLGEKEPNLRSGAGPMELSANDFQITPNLAAEVIQKEGVQGEAETIDRDKAVQPCM